jgi:S-adenosylmethionine:tRNA ribosyltransferase-isomerase
MRLSDFDFDLPPRLIAQHPLADRSGSRLLHVHEEALDDLRFTALPEPAARGRPAGDERHARDPRTPARRARRTRRTGRGADRADRRRTRRGGACCARARPRSPARCWRSASARATVTGRADEFFTLRFDEPVLAALEREGHTAAAALHHACAAGDDDARYQTVYARAPARWPRPPPACISTRRCSRAARHDGVGIAHVTLHVGAGTFQPVRVDDVSRHVMHSERYDCRPRLAEAIAAHACDGRARGGRGHDRAARARVLRARDGGCRRGQRRDAAVHHARLPLPRRRCADHQFPPAEVDAADAGVGVRGPRARIRRAYAMRSTTTTGSSATAMRCCCTAAPAAEEAGRRMLNFEVLASDAARHRRRAAAACG